MPSTPDLIAQINKLFADYNAVVSKARYPDLSDLSVEVQELAVRMRAAIVRIAPGASSYSHDMNAVDGWPAHSRLDVYLGILRALAADIDEGWIEGVAELLHASTFSDFLDQATELQVKGFKDAAAVIAGSALEAHIRLLCDKYSVATMLPSGEPKKVDVMNADLVKAGAYNNLQQKAVTSWLGIRNSSAHGQYNDYDARQVRSLIDAVREFILRYPA